MVDAARDFQDQDMNDEVLTTDDDVFLSGVLVLHLFEKLRSECYLLAAVAGGGRERYAQKIDTAVEIAYSPAARLEVSLHYAPPANYKRTRLMLLLGPAPGYLKKDQIDLENPPPVPAYVREMAKHNESIDVPHVSIATIVQIVAGKTQGTRSGQTVSYDLFDLDESLDGYKITIQAIAGA